MLVGAVSTTGFRIAQDLPSNSRAIVRRLIQNVDLAEQCIDGLTKAGLNPS